LDYSEIILAGDLNWDWLKPCSDEFKSFCDKKVQINYSTNKYNSTKIQVGLQKCKSKLK